MSYLQDKKEKRKKLLIFVAGVVFFFIFFYFRSGIFSGLSFVSHKAFSPVLVLGNNIGGKFQNVGSYFTSKNSLSLENIALREELLRNRALILNYDSILSENINLKEILGRKDEKVPTILATILEKPNQSLYDTIVVDIGLNKGVKNGDLVFALSYSLGGEAVGSVPIGKVSDVYPNSSKVILFSTSKEETQVVVPARNASSIAGAGGGDQNVFMEVVGRGGGNFEMTLPRDFMVQKGDQVVLPGINPRVLGVVETIISDPRDSFIKALLVSPVNIQELKFVEIEIK